MTDRFTRRRVLAGLVASAGIGGLQIFAGQSSAVVDVPRLNLDDVSVTSDDGTLNYIRVKAHARAEWDGFNEDVHHFRWFDVVQIAPHSDDPDTFLINDTGVVPETGLEDGKQPGGDQSGDGSDRQTESWGGTSGPHGGEHFSDAGKAGYVHADIDWKIIARDRRIESSLPEKPAPASRFFDGTDDGSPNRTAVRVEKYIRFYGEDGAVGTTYPALDGTQPVDSGEVNPLTGPNAPDWAPADAMATGTFVASVNDQQSTTGASAGSSGTSGSGPNETP